MSKLKLVVIIAVMFVCLLGFVASISTAVSNVVKVNKEFAVQKHVGDCKCGCEKK